MIEYGIEDLPDIGRKIAQALRPGDVVGLSGGLGAGKTTLARAILSDLGLAGEAPSPSYAIVQPYEPPETDIPVLHVDLYRLSSPAEMEELAIFEDRDSHLIMIEWPEHGGGRMPRDMLRLAIDFHGESRRSLTATVPEAWEGRWYLT